jgi:hypothetical protein
MTDTLKPDANMIAVARRNIRQFLSKASFAMEVDRQAALTCVDVLESAIDATPAVSPVAASEYETLAANLSGMVEGVGETDPAVLYSADYSAPDGDVFVARAAVLLRQISAQQSISPVAVNQDTLTFNQWWARGGYAIASLAGDTDGWRGAARAGYEAMQQSGPVGVVTDAELNAHLIAQPAMHEATGSTEYFARRLRDMAKTNRSLAKFIFSDEYALLKSEESKDDTADGLRNDASIFDQCADLIDAGARAAAQRSEK